MQIFRLSVICILTWTFLGIVRAGHHGGGYGGLGALLGVGILAHLLQGGHGGGGHHHHHVHHVYVPIPVKHHKHHHGHGGGYY